MAELKDLNECNEKSLQESCKESSDARFKCAKCVFLTDSEALMLLHSVNHGVPEDMQLTDTDDNEIDDEKLSHDENETDADLDADLDIDPDVHPDVGPDVDQNIDRHKDKNHNKNKNKKHYKYKCPCCHRLFSRHTLKKHIYVHTSEKPYRCKECHQCFTNIYCLRSHQKKHVGIREAFCPQCGASFASKKSLSKHILIHREDRPKSFLCEVCGVAFYDKESLKAHSIRMHLPKDARKFKCQFAGCRYSCLYQHQLLEHQKVHSDDKPFACDQCDYTAKSKWTFKKHYRKHTKERPFVCPHCDYASGLSSNLTRHLRIHTGSKPFKCPYCEYSCNNHENLRKHVLNTKKHQGLFLYNCTHCEFGTNVFIDLRKHFEQNHSDIYSVEEIDRMVSSIYHKHEDNTTLLPPIQSNEDLQQENSDSNNFETILIKQDSELESEPQVIVLRPIVHSFDVGENFILPTSNDDKSTIVLTDYENEIQLNDIKRENNSETFSKGMNASEVIIIDSNVLEAEEICVSESPGKHNSHIVIAVANNNRE